MISLRVQVDVKPFLANLSAIAEKQIPFAIAKSLTQVGLEGQKAERAHFASVFTLRKPDFIAREGAKLVGGIATKTKPEITFAVTEKAGFLAKFEQGTRKVPTRSRSLSVPLDVRRNKRDLITNANRPRQLIERLGKKSGAGGVFKLDTRTDKLPAGIYQRTGRGGHRLKLLFASEPAAKTPRVLNFRATFERIAKERWADVFAKNFADALRTAK